MKTKEVLPIHILPGTRFLASDQRLAFGEHSTSHRIDFYAIIWFTEDQNEHFIDFEPFPIRKNSVYLIAEKQVHAIPSHSLPDARVIVFSSDFFHSIDEVQLRQLFLPFENDGIQIPAEMVAPMENLFTLILLEYRGASDFNLLSKYTATLLFHLYRFSSQRLSIVSNRDSRMIRLLQLIQQHFREQKPVSFYAKEIGLTPKRVNEILKDVAEVTISQLCHQLLLLESKRMLFNAALSIKEIAYQLSFSDQSYFSRFFRKYTGTTPEQFRAKTAK